MDDFQRRSEKESSFGQTVLNGCGVVILVVLVGFGLLVLMCTR